MTKIEKIEREIQTLSAEELSALRNWFIAYDAGVWNAEIEVDAESGKLDSLGEAALESHRQRQTREL